MAYAYTPAFVAFCSGAPLEEISQEFDIPIESLKAKIRQDGWRGLANRMAGGTVAEVTPHDDALNKIEANRAKNYETAAKLREHLTTVIDALRAGTLRIKKRFQCRGQVIEYEAMPGPADWLNIATYARTIAELTYRALGDHAANGGHRADAGPGTPPPAPPVTIVLPDAIARPRSERRANAEPGEANGIMPLSLPAPPEA